MDTVLKTLFSKFGTAATVDGRQVSVLFQPKCSQQIQRSFSTLGEIPQGQYVCYFPEDVTISVGSTLVVEAHTYEICQVEALRGLPGGGGYQWTLCRRKGSEVL